MAVDANKLVAVYIKIRDAKEEFVREHEAKLAVFNAQLDAIGAELLDICKTNGQDGGKTTHGSFNRSIKSRYWTGDWGSMISFIKQHDAMHLLEQRIHQTNMKSFLQENPTLMPEGLNVESKYIITVRRTTGK